MPGDRGSRSLRRRPLPPSPGGLPSPHEYPLRSQPGAGMPSGRCPPVRPYQFPSRRGSLRPGSTGHGQTGCCARVGARTDPACCRARAVRRLPGYDDVASGLEAGDDLWPGGLDDRCCALAGLATLCLVCGGSPPGFTCWLCRISCGRRRRPSSAQALAGSSTLAMSAQ